ncbi:MAG: 3-phosphoserine/phosphohydroxythreonine aminotransferase [Actinobacteria bacterium]|nr:3-phosphoserine/phosphohydroxythreonine aminotransferase [Actinomycetota bacterium]|tara:strand:- start:4564 stop:5646 length:1083 start_codon:yes stop_codon:yes gene_type:complete
MRRVHNFSAGPCTLPLEVLEETQGEFLNFADIGMSIIEDSHRGPSYEKIHQNALSSFRRLTDLPDDFTVLFLQGGATLQFAQSAMNLLAENEMAGYVNTGVWGQKSLEDASRVANVYEVWSGQESGFTKTPDSNELNIRQDTKWLHITSNETIGGIRFEQFPDVDIPMVADMSSDFLSRNIDWEKFDLVYGGAQKNLGPAGLAIVVVRRESLGKHGRNLPTYLDYQFHEKNDSLGNTPPMFPIYVMGKVLDWMEKNGGLVEFERRADIRSSLIYEVIDKSDGWYSSPVATGSRSLMNIIFHLPDETLENRFIEEAAALDLINLKGHRSVGGVRTSLYNAMPVESVEILSSFMKDFLKSNG